MITESVPLPRRLTGALLRYHRERLGLRIEESAALLECNVSKISRIETGQRGIRAQQLIELLDAYGTGEDEHEAIVAIGKLAEADWLREYRHWLPGNLVDQAVAESLAGEICAYDPQMVPAFLQTPGYAEAVIAADPALELPDEFHMAGALTSIRAECLHKERAPGGTVVISEAVLTQRVGTAGVMPEQLRQLAGCRDLPQPVTVQVIPFAAGAHPGIGVGPRTVIRIRGISGVGVVCGGTGAVETADYQEITSLLRWFEALRAAALNPHQSRRLIERAAERLA